MLKHSTILAIVCLALCGCTRQRDYRDAERYIIESEHAWADSVATGDVSIVQRILADDFVGVDPLGQFCDKAKMLAITPEGPKYFASNHANAVKVRFYGDAAVAQRDETWERRSGAPRRGRFVSTDTWVKRSGKWQIVAAENLIVPEQEAKQ